MRTRSPGDRSAASHGGLAQIQGRGVRGDGPALTGLGRQGQDAILDGRDGPDEATEGRAGHGPRGPPIEAGGQLALGRLSITSDDGKVTRWRASRHALANRRRVGRVRQGCDGGTVGRGTVGRSTVDGRQGGGSR